MVILLVILAILLMCGTSCPCYIICGHINAGDHHPLVLTHLDSTTTALYNFYLLNEDYLVA